MSDCTINTDRLMHLVEMVCDDEASDSEIVELNTALLNNYLLRCWYLDYCQIRVALRLSLRARRAAQKLHQQMSSDRDLPDSGENGATSGGETSLPIARLPLFSAALHGTFGYLSSGWPMAYLMAAVIMGIGLAIAAVVCVSRPTMVVEHLKPTMEKFSRLAPQAELVGRITGKMDCVWGRDGERVNQKSAIRKLKSPIALGDTFTLRSGLLEITYDTGAKVILQGPVTYEVKAKNGGFLGLGKLTGRVTAKAARGFTIHTAIATVTDIGTEFGVEVHRQGGVDACVLEGRVEVTPLISDGHAGFASRLQRGESVRIENDGSMHKQRIANTGRFVRQLPAVMPIHDDFSIPHDYLAKNVAGTIWSGLLNADKASQLEACLADREGQLTIAVPKNVNAGWAEPNCKWYAYANIGWAPSDHIREFKNAPFLYVDVPKGDFRVQVEVKSQTAGKYSVAGLLARHDDNNFVSVHVESFATGDSRCATRYEEVNADAPERQQTPIQGSCRLELVRMGDTFLAYRSVDGGQVWMPLAWGNGLTIYRRPSMTGPLQVGLWYGTFTQIEGAATFGHFHIKTGRSSAIGNR